MIGRPELDAAVVHRLEEYMEQFRHDFSRCEQLRWASIYIQGLLCPAPRKNVRRLSASVVLPDELQTRDTMQALQHFIDQSPWDERKLWRHYRALVARRLVGLPGDFVVDEISFPKQGHKSVGVQRQYSRVVGKKINCQVVVVLSYLTPAGHVPVALRLYLPRNWAQDTFRLDIAGVPPEYRHGGGSGRTRGA